MLIRFDTRVVFKFGHVGEKLFEDMGEYHMIGEEEDEDRDKLLPAHKTVVVDCVSKVLIKGTHSVEKHNFK